LPDGLLVIDKPEGPTSHDVVARARRALHERRIGHTGTLDPLATGVLPLLLGRATRLTQFLTAEDKRYVADIRLGAATTTYDREGTVVGTRVSTSGVTAQMIAATLLRFRGTFAQTPPPYSAKKVGGISAHRLARQGRTPPLRPVDVTVHELRLLDFSRQDVRIELRCSPGFYVRSLAHDLGAALGCGAYLQRLRRTASGALTIEQALSLADLEAGGDAVRTAIRPLSTLLQAWPAIRVTGGGAVKVRQGVSLGRDDCENWDVANAAGQPRDRAPVSVRLLDGEGNLLGLAAWVWPQSGEAFEGRTSSDLVLLHPRIVLV
jgi:tRNA pseudouridine55 synthase